MNTRQEIIRSPTHRQILSVSSVRGSAASSGSRGQGPETVPTLPDADSPAHAARLTSTPSAPPGQTRRHFQGKPRCSPGPRSPSEPRLSAAAGAFSCPSTLAMPVSGWTVWQSSAVAVAMTNGICAASTGCVAGVPGASPPRRAEVNIKLTFL